MISFDVFIEKNAEVFSHSNRMYLMILIHITDKK